MNGFEFDQHIAAPPERVFEVLADPTRASAFLDNITQSTKLIDGPTGVGTVFRETRVVGGKESSADLLVTAHEPNTHLGISTEAEGITVEYHYRLTPDAHGTRLSWACELQAAGLRRMMLPVIAAIMKREDGGHLRKLKAYLENW